MLWPPIEAINSLVDCPPGYRLERLHYDDVEKLISHLSVWYPEIEVGAGSQFLDPQYYYQQTSLSPQNSEQAILPLVFLHENKMCGFVAYEKDVYRGSLMAHTLAIAEEHRQSGLGTMSNVLLEKMGREMNTSIVYWYASLLHPYSQWVGEKRKWKLCGIIPAFNVRKIEGKGETRIFTAMYAKVLVDDDAFYFPKAENLTEQTQALYEFLFGR